MLICVIHFAAGLYIDTLEEEQKTDDWTSDQTTDCEGDEESDFEVCTYVYDLLNGIFYWTFKFNYLHT